MWCVVPTCDFHFSAIILSNISIVNNRFITGIRCKNATFSHVSSACIFGPFRCLLHAIVINKRILNFQSNIGAQYKHYTVIHHLMHLMNWKSLWTKRFDAICHVFEMQPLKCCVRESRNANRKHRIHFHWHCATMTPTHETQRSINQWYLCFGIINCLHNNHMLSEQHIHCFVMDTTISKGQKFRMFKIRFAFEEKLAPLYCLPYLSESLLISKSCPVEQSASRSILCPF